MPSRLSTNCSSSPVPSVVDHQRLGFAAGEQRRAVGARQDADFGHDRAHGDEVAPVDALLGVEHRIAHDMGFQIVHQAGELAVVQLAFADEFRRRFGADFLDAVAAHMLFGDLGTPRRDRRRPTI